MLAQEWRKMFLQIEKSMSLQNKIVVFPSREKWKEISARYKKKEEEETTEVVIEENNSVADLTTPSNTLLKLK